MESLGRRGRICFASPSLHSLRSQSTEKAGGNGVSARRINEVVKGIRVVTANTDLRLCRFKGTGNAAHPV